MGDVAMSLRLHPGSARAGAMFSAALVLFTGMGGIAAAAPSNAVKSVTVGAADDTYINAGDVSQVHGDEPTFRSTTDARWGRKTAYVRFDLKGVPAGASVAGARLTLTRTDHHFPPVVAVRGTASNWSEA